MGVCSWICFGFFAGLVARALLPGDQSMGIVKTTLLGIAGAFVGGFLGALVSGDPLGEVRTAGFVGAVLGAIVILVVGEVAFGRRRRR